MNKLSQEKNNSQKRSFRWLEGILLVLVLCIAVLRLSFIETPQNNVQNALLPTTPRGMSLLLSSVLFIAAISGLLLQILQGQWRPGWGVIIGWILFSLAAGLSAGFAASDKRAAMTEGFTLVVPMLAAIVLFRWLDSNRRIDVVLWVILSMGCAAVYVSADQYLDSNQKVVEDYQRNPQRQLQMLGIEPNSLAQFQYEHRLHSKDIRGFLTTSNSTGTFLLAGIFIAAGFLVDTFRNRKDDAGFAARLVVLILILLVLAAGLGIGQSRGALAAGGLSAVLFIVLVCFGRQFWRCRWLILMFLLLAFVGVWVIATAYGLKHNRLPGPNAMYVRWQYWVGAVKMAAEHPLGIGGGNFGTFYPLYKIPAAPETVSDPHNIILSILCQFGPLGLLGFLLAVFMPLWRGIKNTFENPAVTIPPDKPTKAVSFGVLVAVTATLLFARPFVSEGGLLGETSLIRQSVFVVMYLLPAFFFVCSFGLLWATGKETPSSSSRQGLAAGLICAVVGILIHNLIDFALFEPGVWTVFWILIALIMAIHSSPERSISTSKPVHFLLSAIFLVVALVALYLCVWVPVRAGTQFQAGLKDYDNSSPYFQQAAQIDPFDPDPLLYEAQFYLSRIESSQIKKEEHLTQAAAFSQQARRRNPHNYAYSELLSGICIDQSKVNKENEKEYLESAYQAGMEAGRLYPGSDRIAFDLGMLAERMGQPQKAIEHFCWAAEIEDQYRKQFSEMYPDYPLCSRLGQNRYEYAKNYIQKEYKP
jgi:O-antigen ligase